MITKVLENAPVGSHTSAPVSLPSRISKLAVFVGSFWVSGSYAVQVSPDGGSTWETVETITSNPSVTEVTAPIGTHARISGSHQTLGSVSAWIEAR